MKKNYVLWTLLAIIALGAVGAIAFKASPASQKGSFPPRVFIPIPVIPAEHMQVTVLGKNNQPVKDVVVEMYASKEAVQKSYAITSANGTAILPVLDYDSSYFVGFGPDGTVYGGLFTDPQECNNISFHIESDRKVHKYVNMQGPQFDVVNRFTIHPVSYYFPGHTVNGRLICPAPTGQIPMSQTPVPPPPSSWCIDNPQSWTCS